jgi:hypothetical protein
MAIQIPTFESKRFGAIVFNNKVVPRIIMTLALAGFVFWTFAYVCGTQIFMPDPGATLMTVRVILAAGFVISTIFATRWVFAGFRSN